MGIALQDGDGLRHGWSFPAAVHRGGPVGYIYIRQSVLQGQQAAVPSLGRIRASGLRAGAEGSPSDYWRPHATGRLTSSQANAKKQTGATMQLTHSPSRFLRAQGPSGGHRDRCGRALDLGV